MLIDSKIGILIAVVFGIVEIAEKFGLAKKYAHLIALPLGILGSFLFLKLPSASDHIIYGLFTGIAAVGSCDTICNVIGNIQDPENKK